MKSPKSFVLPAAGGSYTIDADGNLVQVAASTKPSPGKTALAEAAAKAEKDAAKGTSPRAGKSDK
jgi:hypothetical protein